MFVAVKGRCTSPGVSEKSDEANRASQLSKTDAADNFIRIKFSHSDRMSGSSLSGGWVTKTLSASTDHGVWNANRRVRNILAAEIRVTERAKFLQKGARIRIAQEQYQ